MKKILLFLPIVLTLLPFAGLAGTFTSNGTGGGNWSTSTSWAFSGDADGIPDADDDITILSGDQVNWAVNSAGRNITVNAGGILSSSGGATKVLGVYGNFIINGTESCIGTIEFRTNGSTVGGTGTHGSSSIWIFSANTTIASTITVTKNYYIRVYGATTVVTNFANLTLYSINASTNGAKWVQGTNSTVKIRTSMLMNSPAVGVFDAHTNINTVYLDFTPLKLVPIVENNTYYNLIIPSNRYATTQADLIILNDLNVGNNSIINVNHNINIRRHFTLVVGATFNAAAGTILTFDGNVTQNLTSGININFRNLVINNTGATGVTIVSARTYNVLESLRLVDGVFNVSAATSFNLVSNASQTAVVGPSTTAASVTGNMRLQRFIAARAAGYSDMAGSIQSQTLADWDDELLLVYAYSPPSAYPSVFSYDESIWDYVPVTSSAQALTPGKGFEVYLDSDGGQTTFNNTTVINTGRPNIGSFNISSTITFDNDGWNLVGNPYHANISWDALQATTTGISPDIMFYDETIEDFTTVTTGSGQLIAPNQGFWVNATTGSPTFIFTEAIKSNSLSSNFRSTPENMFTLRLKSVGGTRFTSGTSFRFANDPSLAEKGSLPFKGLPNPQAPTLKSVSDQGKSLKINLLNSNQDFIEVPLLFTVGEDGLYTLEAQDIESLQFEGYTCALLADRKTGKTINLLNENYQFYAQKGEDEGRFALQLVKNGNCNSNIEVANGQIDINRLGENTVVKLNFEKETQVNITITNLLGEQISPAQNISATAQNVYLPVPANFSGIYLVNVFYDGRVESKKLFR